MIAGLEKADKGNIRISGNKVTKPGPDRVVVFQEAGLISMADRFGKCEVWVAAEKDAETGG